MIKDIYAIKGAVEMLSKGKSAAFREVRQGFPEEFRVNAVIES